MKLFATTLLFSSLLAVGCGSKQPATETAASTTGGSSAATTDSAENVAWADKTEKQKKKHMKKVVLPAMRKLFQESPDPEEKIGCDFCHGPGVEEGDFEMPNSKLPKLDPTDHFAAHKEKKGEMLEFMMKRVAPTMTKLLKVEPWSPENPKGFGCFNCHEQKQ